MPADPQLLEALGQAGLTLPDDQVALLERYCRLLWEWNEKLNLTRHVDFDKFVARDLVDAMVIAGQLAQGERVLDVGSGGGVPGIVLAIVRPDLSVTLSESVGKKATALEEIVHALGLSIAVQHAAAQSLLDSEYFDSLTVRAVAPLTKLLTWFAPHAGAFGRLLVIKGPAWVEERHEARQKRQLGKLQLRKLAAWPLPGTHSESVLLEIQPKQDDDD